LLGTAHVLLNHLTMSLHTTISLSGRPRYAISCGALRARRKFLHFFRNGFSDPKYVDWERSYKWNAHLEWCQTLGKAEFKKLLGRGEYSEVAARAVRLESRTNLLFSFEKMALRDAVKNTSGARQFSEGLFDLVYGSGGLRARFQSWLQVVSALPRKQTRVFTWPVVTVFGFIARPNLHIFLKPRVTREAASEYGFIFDYTPRPNWRCYENLCEFAHTIKSDLKDLHPKDLIDVQSFIWVQGSSEYME
jgi:hypothetical protein